ncbi:MAG: hypothetical protein QOJ85_3362, partial [Solirubrobacteraceae bacterium]|nr:hypothetical protein [Solirubrobacteraceae bacterium]
RLLSAARRAMARGAVDEAIVLLSRALQEPPRLAARYEVLMMLAQAGWLARDEAAIEHARAALQVADGPAQHEAAALLLARLLSPAGHPQQAVDVLACAATRLREVAPERALSLDVQRLSCSFVLPNPPDDIIQTGQALVTQLAPDSMQAQILNATIAALAAWAGAVPATAAAELALSALADGRLLKDPSAVIPFQWALAALALSDRLDDFSHWAERRYQLTARSGSRLELAIRAAHRARIASLRGDLATAINEARDALQTEGYGHFATLAASSLVPALVEQGELDEAEHVLAKHGIARGVTFGYWRLLVPARITLALAQGEPQRARDQLSALFAAGPEIAGRDLQLAPSEVAIALATGSTDNANERAHAMLNAAERFGAPGPLGIAQRLLGLTTGGTDGLQLLRTAIDTLQLSPRRLELARALIDYGATLRRHNHRAAAREPLRRGMDLAHRCAATTLAHRARDELRATGARPRKLLLNGLDSLTPSELRVARLVAQGLSNPQVAQTLFVTRSTVEAHLQSTFRKLDIRRREQLATILTS